MKIYQLDFSNTEHFGQEDEYLILCRPMRSRLFRTCNETNDTKYNEEFIQVLNTLCVSGRPIKGRYYFKARDFDEFADLSQIFNEMDIKNLFAERDSAPIMTTEKENLN